MRKALILLLITSSLLVGCSSREVEKDTVIEYPYRVIINSGENELGYTEASILSEYDFKIEENKFTMDSSKSEITQIEMPKVTENTRENFGDNIISVENLAKWQSLEDIKYEKYNNSLSEASAYIDTITQIQGLHFGIKSNDYEILDDTVYFAGQECRVIHYRDISDIGFNVCKLLGYKGDKVELDKEHPVYITYYINSDNNILYIGVDASDTFSWLEGESKINMRFELYKDINEEGIRIE